MPWRDDIAIDAVEYSDRPKDEGPAPNGEGVERGQIASVSVCDGARTFDAELQFWRELEARVDIENPVDSAAGYVAWRIGDQHGHFGVFDGHAGRVWLGMETFTDEQTNYAFVDLGEDWRDKIYWNDFVDRIHAAKLQYPAEQAAPIDTIDRSPLVEHDGPTTDVYEIFTHEFGTDEVTFRFQGWRRPSCQAVFIAVRQADDDLWSAKKGVLGRKSILSDIGTALALDQETTERVYEMTSALRSDSLDGLHVQQC